MKGGYISDTFLISSIGVLALLLIFNVISFFLFKSKIHSLRKESDIIDRKIYKEMRLGVALESNYALKSSPNEIKKITELSNKELIKTKPHQMMEVSNFFKYGLGA